jgi:hypothetical protein
MEKTMTEKMKEVLMYCLAEEYEFYPEEYSKNTLRALLKKGFLEVEEDWYCITEQGVKHLGLPQTIRAKRPKTIIKKVLSVLSQEEVEIFLPKEIPAMAAEEDHNNDRTTWYDIDDALFAVSFWGDDMEYVVAQIGCDYAKKEGHDIYFERVQRFLIFYRAEE